jgi:hypothetical protein
MRPRSNFVISVALKIRGDLILNATGDTLSSADPEVSFNGRLTTRVLTDLGDITASPDPVASKILLCAPEAILLSAWPLKSAVI